MAALASCLEFIAEIEFCCACANGFVDMCVYVTWFQFNSLLWCGVNVAQ